MIKSESARGVKSSPPASSHSSEGGNDEAATAVLMSLLEVGRLDLFLTGINRQ